MRKASQKKPKRSKKKKTTTAKTVEEQPKKPETVFECKYCDQEFTRATNGPLKCPKNGRYGGAHSMKMGPVFIPKDWVNDPELIELEREHGMFTCYYCGEKYITMFGDLCPKREGKQEHSEMESEEIVDYKTERQRKAKYVTPEAVQCTMPVLKVWVVGRVFGNMLLKTEFLHSEWNRNTLLRTEFLQSEHSETLRNC
eukprot:TRINITY_DN58038_c0_g1_i1.p1 TRINITY_DN58038_c0_g1~~TRINITY_DN58038_c0_g1_i1.p1  ORF type:complete len:198 (-),score=3.44 TRINITY_DN58038_c0_g1_i1:91-684(-)